MIYAILTLVLFTPGLIVHVFFGGWHFSILFWLLAALYLFLQIARKWKLVLHRDLLRQLLLFQGGALGVGLPIILTRQANAVTTSSLFFNFSLIMFLISMIVDLIYLAVINEDRFIYIPISVVLTTIVVIYYIYGLMGLIFFILTR